MRSGDDFRRTMRRGGKGVQPTVVSHVLLGTSSPGTGGQTSVGFVVSKAVGSAVDRNRVKRQLRHLMRDRVDRLPSGSRVVVRALPPAHGAQAATLAAHLDASLARAGVR
jgi:ribonuclease P protein component